MEFKLFVYFIPLKPGPASKMFLKITDSMYFKSLVEKISEIVNYNISSAIFYSVLKDELKDIYDQKERVVSILNKDSFLFVMEKEKEKEVSDKKIYFPVSFYYYDEDLITNLDFFEDLSCFKLATFPRVFSFEHNEKINNILASLLNYCQIYIEKNDYNVLVKSNRNLISNRFECIFCNKFKSIGFYCGCLKSLGPFKNMLLNKIVNNKFFSPGISVEISIVAKKKRMNVKQLNVCKDYTMKPFSESKIDLYQLMNFFTEKEILEDKIFCNSCESPEYCTKKIEYEKFPQILIISLKRFRYHSNCFKKTTKRTEKLLFKSPEKNTYYIDFPIYNLDLSKYGLVSNEKYELYAVCYHHGSINSGHYTAVCKINEKWYEFNDKIIKEYDEAKIVSSDAYILFYRLKPNGKGKNK
jgi:hypothetical protein